MKYTVVIRQPISDEVRPELEQQLVERFGLNPQQAEKLASRKAGRLLKPTSQTRADLLLQVYQSVGANVLMEEVPEETDKVGGLESSPLAAPAHTTGFGEDVFSAATNTATNPTAQAGTQAADPFAADPFAAAFGGGTSAAPASVDPLMAWAQPGKSTTSGGGAAPVALAEPIVASSVPNLTLGANPEEAQVAQEIAQAAAVSATPAPAAPIADDWADFAGGLNLPETSQPVTPKVEAAPAPNTDFLTAVNSTVVEDISPSQALPRTSLANQIRWGTLLPLGLSSLLTLGVLAVTLPGLQNRVLSRDARTLAATLATNLNTTTSRNITNSQIDNILKNSNVGFVRVGLPDGSTFVRTRSEKTNVAVNKQLTEWLKAHPNGGTVKVNGESYIASRVSVIEDREGAPLVTDFAGEKAGSLVRRVTVGLPANQIRAALLTTLLLTIGSALVGLIIASVLAARAAQRIVQPIEQLVKVADAISLGDLSRPVKATSNDELGDLSQALERMRLSLEAAMDRLRRRKRG